MLSGKVVVGVCKKVVLGGDSFLEKNLRQKYSIHFLNNWTTSGSGEMFFFVFLEVRYQYKKPTTYDLTKLSLDTIK